MIIEDVAWRGLENLGGEFDDYWRITLRFLDIAITAWPQILPREEFVDPATRQNMLIARAIENVAREQVPVIALGSTGSNVVTARLLAAIARAPQGAVVLPGLDQHLDTASFATILNGAEPCATHPQAFLARLIETIGVAREDVVRFGRSAGGDWRTREKFASEAFRPADSTDLWPLWRQQHGQDMAAALADVTLIEALDEREEALAIAVCLREVLETPGRTAALVTPDRGLAERVRAELLRWNVDIDDSGGAPLAASRAGVLARLILSVLSGDLSDWAALLSHPDFSLGTGRPERKARRAVRDRRAALRPAIRKFRGDLSRQPARRRKTSTHIRARRKFPLTIGRRCKILPRNSTPPSRPCAVSRRKQKRR